MASTWTTAQSGSWNVAGNWTGGIPNASNAIANFTTLGATASPWYIDLGGATDTVGTLNLSASAIEHYVLEDGVLAMKIVSLVRGATAQINVSSASTSSFNALDSSLTLNLLSNTTVNNTTAGTFDIGAKITGAFGLIATGLGTILIDNAANTWSGGLVINGGTVLTTAANVLAGGDLNMAATTGILRLYGYNQSVGNLSGGGLIDSLAGNATLSINETTNTTFSGTFEDGLDGGGSSAALSLTKNGAGTLTLASTQNITQGAVTINQGAIALGSELAFSIYNNVAIAAGAALDLAGNDTQIESISGAGSVVNSGSGTDYLQMTGVSNFSGSISGAISVQLDDPFTALTLSGANTYTGGTLLLDGSTLTAGANNAFSSASAFYFDPTSTIDLNGFNETISKISGTGTITNRASSPSSSLLTFQNSGVTIFTGNIVNGAAGGAIGLDVAGAGQFVMAGTAAYSGITTIETGVTLVAGADNAFSAGSVIDAKAAATLDLAGYDEAIGGLADTGTVTSSLAGDATLTVGTSAFSGAITDGAGVVDLSVAAGAAFQLNGQSNTFSGATSIGASAILYAGGYGALSANSAINVSSTGLLILLGYDQTIGGLSGSGAIYNSTASYTTLTVDETVSSTFSGQFKASSPHGSLNLDKAGAGTLTLSGNNAQAGDMSVVAGTLAAGASNAFTTTGQVTVYAGATLDLGGYDQTIGYLGSNFGGGGTVTNSGATAATLTINGANNSFAGTLKDGASALSLRLGALAGVGLSGVNTYSGLTKIGAGARLYAGATNAFSANSAVTIGLTGVLDINGFNETVGAISGTGNITNNGAAPSALITKTSGVSTLAGVIANGAGGGVIALDVAGSGKLVLAGTNTYSGGTTVEAGATLAAAATYALSANSVITVKAGGTLDLANYNQIVAGLVETGTVTGGNMEITGNSTINNGSTLTLASLTEVGPNTTLSMGTLTYAGYLTQSAGTLTLPGTLTLTGGNSLTGAITGAGQLSVAGGYTTIQSGSTLSVAKLAESGASTLLTINALSYAGALTQTAGTLTLPGTLTLTGTNSLTGTITGAGQLSVTGGSTTINTGSALTLTKLAESGVGTTLSFGTLSYAGALTMSSGTLSLLGTLTLSGANNALTGTINGAGKLSIAGGSTKINAGTALSMASWSLSAGVVTVAEAATYAGAFTMSGGTLGLAGGMVTLSGADTITGGTVVGANVLLTSGAAKTVSGFTVGQSTKWQNATTVNESAASVTIGGATGTSTLDNTSTGIYDLLGNVGILKGAASTSTLTNEGLLEKTGGTGVSTIAPAVTNTGTIEVTKGILDFQGAVTGTGADTILGAAMLEFDSSVAAGQSISFSGSGGTLDLGAPQSFAGAVKGFDLGGATNDAIEVLTGWTFTGATEGATSTTLAFVDGATHASLTLQGDYTGTFHATPVTGGTKITYAA